MATKISPELLDRLEALLLELREALAAGRKQGKAVKS
jgi:hypothetical protein